MKHVIHETPAQYGLRFTDEQFIWRFSPNQTDPDLLEAIFVGREPLLQNVLEKIADSATSSATHHALIYGPRGIGKSHFISLLHHRLITDANLRDSIQIAWLNEDETTTSMVQLLVRIYRSLCKWYPHDYSVEWLNELLDQPPDEIAAVLTRRLVARFERRRLIILVENLNLLFENLGTEGQHQLRTLLHEHPFACLIATSQQLFKAVTDRSEPFFGFFQQIPLKPLTLPDAQQLLTKIAETKGQTDLVQFLNTPDGRGRVRALHDLAGGNHRVYIVLSGFVTRESLDQLITPFQKMADDLTPYYQERLRWVSPLQRQIVELLCRQHGTVNPKEIARRLLVDQRSIGKQVRLLEEIGYLTSTKRGRETYYELSEPLMRLAYEVKEQSLLQMLIEFLRIWYRPAEIHELRSAGLNQTTQAHINAAWNDLGDCAAMFSLIFQFSEDEAELKSRISTLVDLYQQAAEKHGFRRPDPRAKTTGFTNTTAGDGGSTSGDTNPDQRSPRPAVNPLSHLADGLVRSLAKIDKNRVTPAILESYVVAVERRVAALSEFEIPLRLFRYGIRYLISGRESEFVELIQAERRILRQSLGLPEET